MARLFVVAGASVLAGALPGSGCGGELESDLEARDAGEPEVGQAAFDAGDENTSADASPSCTPGSTLVAHVVPTPAGSVPANVTAICESPAGAIESGGAAFFMVTQYSPASGKIHGNVGSTLAYSYVKQVTVADASSPELAALQLHLGSGEGFYFDGEWPGPIAPNPDGHTWFQVKVEFSVNCPPDFSTSRDVTSYVIVELCEGGKWVDSGGTCWLCPS